METKILTENIANYCRAHSISKAEFERQCGLSNGMVRSWERGLYSSGLRSIEKISKKTNIPMASWLTKGAVECRGISEDQQSEETSKSA